ncbi:MAG TPA: glucose 1-dehydrogenase [Caulobacteraceae bacterium]|jgi:3-oxoacyl-[acyl-carrier protein] reductase|nr:glucose 1-dehydrogenase [Caulobacteraceae bacterium]
MIPVDLTGRVAFVSGAGRGIGLATTRRLLEAGSTVVANVRQLDEEVSQSIRDLDAGDRLLVIEGSVADPAVVEAAARTVFERFRRLDILVNNAGIMRDAYIGMIQETDIQEVLATNVGGVIRLTQAMSRIMKRRKAGSIVNVASIIGQRGNVAELVYGASKAAVIGATLSAAKELAAQGIRVNAVAPGLIDTRMTAELPAETRQRLTGQIALGRTGSAEEVADAILFLVSDLSRYITGQVIGVDGGLVI